jgi:hypothetical protein
VRKETETGKSQREKKDHLQHGSKLDAELLDVRWPSPWMLGKSKARYLWLPRLTSSWMAASGASRWALTDRFGTRPARIEPVGTKRPKKTNIVFS